MSRAPGRRKKGEPATPAGPARPSEGAAQPPPDDRERRDDADAKIDEAAVESFPASDPPAWTPGVV